MQSSQSEDRSEGSKGPAVVELDLSEGAPEETGSSPWNLKQAQSYFHLISVLHDLPTDPGARGAFVRLGITQMGFARAQEIAELLEQTRRAGKKVVCHAHGYTNTTFWIAARGCDRIWVSPAGEVGLVGIAAQLLFAHQLLAEKLGIDIDFLQVGKYKGAEEMYTRDGPSPEARASLQGVLEAIRAQWLDGIGQRGAPSRAHAEDGPFCPETARRRGLIDAAGDANEARKDAKKLAEVDTVEVRFGHAARAASGPQFGKVLHSLAGGGTNFGGAPHVSVVRATGAISMDSSGGMTDSSGVSERALGRVVRKLADDASARAVVLRIDSPGGSALASDLLWKDLMDLRGKKPLVVSIGDMAASGGYYLASAATRIFAEPASIVGSIGVVGGKLSFGHALGRVGVHVEIVGAAQTKEGQARAAYESPFQAWDGPTRERVREQMTAIYELFVRRVSEGRKLPIEKVAAAAEGRIFAGPATQEAGLVDEWGGLDRAIAVAKQLAMLDDGAPVRLVGTSSGLWNLLDGDDDDGAEDSEPRSQWAARAGTLAAAAASPSLASLLPGLKDGFPSPLSAAEWGTVRGHLASIEPLVGREHAIAALPFVLLLH